ncbi:MAG: Pyruvate carboxylase [Firmicutes bacterium]|nr:Pyruvate carboxylase [Bacillota bacterium]
MRKYLIKVNGVSYEVEVEEIGSGFSAPAAVPAYAPAAVAAGSPAPAAAASAPAPTPAAPSAPAAPAAPAPAAPAGAMGSDVVKAPMPGTILNIAVAAGASVKKGQVLCVLEAMKMENEIVSPRDGVVAGIHTGKGNSVQAGEPLVSLQ